MKWIVGIDEAGRGALAGPVAVGLVAIQERSDASWLTGVRDSKKLSPQQREAWFKRLKAQAKNNSNIQWSVIQISNKEIDRRGISKCVYKGIEKLLSSFSDDSIILLDGSLKAPSRFTNQTTIIRGDDIEPLISIASISAKATRDHHMVRLSKKYSYGFDIHKGYGTKLHRQLIKEHGHCSIHRSTFLSNILKIKSLNV